MPFASIVYMCLGCTTGSIFVPCLPGTEVGEGWGFVVHAVWVPPWLMTCFMWPVAVTGSLSLPHLDCLGHPSFVTDTKIIQII